jgi:methylated-DNA-protein-cysteine methyltransferase-like protein
MPQSEEAAAWFAAVCEAVQQIPYGKVCTYGHIARLVGHPERPRQVGIVMKTLPDAASGLQYHSGNVPWQRVINAKGGISPRYVW